MKIYTAENDVAELILSNRSISTSSILSKIDSLDLPAFNQSINTLKTNDSFWSKASLNDSDLYYRKSIFLTTTWNKNDDVFDPEEVWIARNTASHKPTNIGHKQSDIVGHITHVWAITKDGELISDNTPLDNLNDFYHVVNGSVIYTGFEDEEMRLKVNNLISEIDSGKKYVSMENVFNHFDYAVITPEGEKYIVARNKDTAFLTKHLRQYKGTGTFDGCRVGRLLRNMTFIGKGYVDKPANPYSIIFSESESLNFSKAALYNPFKISGGVYINMNNLKSENNMSSLEGQGSVLQPLVAAATLREGPDISEIITKAISVAFAKEHNFDELNSKINSLTSELETVKAEYAKAMDEKENLKNLSNSLQLELTAVKANQVKTDRIAVLTGKGVDRAVAESKVDILLLLDDAQFASVVEDIVKANTNFTSGDSAVAKNLDNNDDDDEIEVDASASSATPVLIDKAIAGELPTSTNLAVNPNIINNMGDALRNEIAEALKSKKSKK